MKKIKRIVTAALAVAMLAGCGGQPASTSGASGAQGVQTDGDRTYINGTLDVTGMPDVELENKKVTIYCWGEYVPEYENDWEGFRFEDYYGGEVEVIVSNGDYYENLYKLVAAGEIPDIVVGEATSFPSMIMRDLVQPWDEYLDYDDPVWDETGARDSIEEMRWNGSIYNMTARSHNLGVMFYNKRIVESTGLEDPAELQARGEWTWDTFRQYLEETTLDTNGDGVTDIYGIVNTGDFPIALFCSTGETHIEYTDGQFINNLKSPKVQDAANFLYDIGNNGDKLMLLGDPVADFLAGKAAFVYTNDYRGYIDYADLWETDGLGVVPMPTYPNGDGTQYQAALNDNLWLMKGAQNPEGAALMVLCERYDSLLNMDPEAGSARQTQINSWLDHGFTEEAAEAVVDLQELPVKVIWSRSITMPEGNLEYRAMDEPWTTLAESMEGAVDQAIANATTPITG